MTEIYLDNAAATPLAPQAARAMMRAMATYGNPSSFHDAGRRAAALLSQARQQVAGFLRARPDEVVFCGSGSEANSLALLGAARAYGKRGTILRPDTEHPSVLESIRQLAREGQRTVVIPVDAQGAVTVEDVVSRLTSATIIVSLAYANNEIGTIQPVAKIGQAIARWRRANRTAYPLFHIDACQATTTLDMDVQRLGADLLTLNGTKAYGPHNAAVLYVRRGITLRPLVYGGHQEGGRRAGTEDVVGATGLAAALTTVRPGNAKRMASLRDRLIAGVLNGVPDAHVNGPAGSARLAGNVNISIPGCDSEGLLLELDKYGIRAGSGSACTAHSVEPSHVLIAIGTPKRYLDGVLRFTLGRATTRADIDRVIRVLPGVVATVRARHMRTGRSS